jgi:chromosome segregation ATPase
MAVYSYSNTDSNGNHQLDTKPMTTTPNTTPTPTQRVEQASYLQQNNPVVPMCIALQLAKEYEAAQKSHNETLSNGLDLIDKNEDLRQQLADKTRECGLIANQRNACGKMAADLAVTVNKLRAENAELKKDKERLDWLVGQKTLPSVHCGDFHYWGNSDSRESLRTAIDAARKEQS